MTAEMVVTYVFYIVVPIQLFAIIYVLCQIRDNKKGE